jgi:TRAP-type C4-dicarboxylate transport system permease small subunit
MPLLGGLELLELSMAVFGGFAILYTTTRRGHISVDLFFIKFPKHLQIAILCFGSILGSAVWGVIAYRVFVLGKQSLKTKFSSAILNIPIGPFEIVLAFALALYSLVLLIQAFRPPVTKGSEDEEGELNI